ncbi:Carbohydrate-binding family 6 protein [Histomonas meleagridis]|nr:Carbohydrate-binding family 6 protein [Histomonas meleagridis]KAH0797998.1 Carbohydrate-binding family 6 protein [Histomonas meleagridis]
MKTSQPFHTFDPQKYIKRRYSPLVVTVVEDDVEQLFKQSNLTFTDFLAAFVEYDNNPMRIITGDMLRQETQEELLMNVRNDTFLFSQSFAFQEFEDSDATDPQLSPIPDLFPKAIHYPSKESMNPPWFSLFAEKLLKSMQFTDFDFCDLPTCIVYATKSNSQIPLKTPTDVIHSIAFPQWMNEFVSGIPIVRVIVYDGLVTSASNTSKGQFKEIYHLCFRTRHIDMSAPMDKVTLQNLFKYDTHLTKSDDFFSDVGQSDVKSVKDFLNILHKIITADIEITIKSHDFEIEGMNTVSNKLKNLFSKNVPERVTDYHSIPWKIIIHQKIASLHMILGNYDNSRKSFHEASNLYSSNKQHNDLRLHCLLLHTFSCINKQNFLSHLKDGITYLMSHIAEARSVRFLIMVPLLVAEFYSSLFDYNQSCQLYKLAINKIKKLWSGNIDIRSTILGLLYERLAGLTQDKNHSLLYTSIAAKTYLSCEQIPHALRCYIWLLKLLPNNQWVLLSQTAWLEKAKILCNLNQFMRALNNLKELLALPNLHQSLHEQVMSSFWVPYNQTSLIKEEKKINIRSLLDIKGIQIVDQSEPEYFGLNNDDFMEMINEYDKHAKQALGLTSSVSFDSWYEDSNDYSKKKKIINKVGIGNEIIVIITIPSYWLNNWDGTDTLIGFWNMASDSWSVPPKYRPGIQTLRAFDQLERDLITDDSFAFNIDGIGYRDPLMMNSSHLGGCVQEPTGELWTEYTHYGTRKLPIKIRRSFIMPPNEKFYMVKYQITSTDGATHTVDLLDFLSSGPCNEWARGKCSDGVCTIDQQYCLGYGTAISVDTTHEVSYTMGNGQFTESDNPLTHFQNNGEVPSFPEYDQFKVGFGALYKNLQVTTGTITIISYRAFGRSLDDARSTLTKCLSKTSSQWEATTNTLYTNWINSGEVPSLTGDALDMYKKSLLVLKNSQNPKLGTIASSLHPLYGYKTWSRDSIMAAFMLDASGHHSEAKLYYDWIPKAPLTSNGAFHTCYNTFTGAEVGFVEPQYDSIGYYLIAMNYHLQCYGDETWVKSHLATIEKFAQWIIDNKGAQNLGLSDRSPWEESTDHHTGEPIPEQYYTFSQSLYYGGLKAAVMIEKKIGTSMKEFSYNSRANEIQQLVLEYLWDDTNSHFYRGRWQDTFMPDTRADSSSLSVIFTGLVRDSRAQSHLNFCVDKLEKLGGGTSRYEGDPYFFDSKWNPCGEGTSETQRNEPAWPVTTAYVAWAEHALGKDISKRVNWMLKYSAYGNMPVGEGVDSADGAMIVPSAPDCFEHGGVYVYTQLLIQGKVKSILETLE